MFLAKGQLLPEEPLIRVIDMSPGDYGIVKGAAYVRWHGKIVTVFKMPGGTRFLVALDDPDLCAPIQENQTLPCVRRLKPGTVLKVEVV